MESENNKPQLWLKYLPFPKGSQHKYDHGHAVIAGGGTECTGAAKLAACAALRIGAGLVTIASPEEAQEVYAKSLMSVMSKPIGDIEEFQKFIEDPRKNIVLIGPGNGVNTRTKTYVLKALELRKSCVLDADALTVFQEKPEELFKAIHSPVVMTPHEGEFARIFSIKGSRGERAMQAAKKSKAIIVLKGEHTVIAAPDGRMVINNNAPACLATAGSGDVLAGMITGLMAKGMPAFEAACAGVWIHGEAANKKGIGLIAEDLPELLPEVLKDLEKITKRKEFPCV